MGNSRLTIKEMYAMIEDYCRKKRIWYWIA